MYASHWEPPRSRIITREEIAEILKEARRRSKRSVHSWRRLIVFGLATLCGLRAREISTLTLRDFRFGADPMVLVRKGFGKGGKARAVPLSWSGDFVSDVEDAVRRRRRQGAIDSNRLLVSRYGRGLNRNEIRALFVTAALVGCGRHATTHDGRHTFVSLALASGANIQAVRAAAGHASLATTSLYAHLVETEESRRVRLL